MVIIPRSLLRFVTRLQINVGDTVTPQTSAAILADLDQLVVRSFVVDDDLEQMLEGQPAQVALSSRPGEFFPALVQAMPLPYGSGEELEANTAVIAFENNSEVDLESGNRVTIELVLDEREDVLWLPVNAKNNLFFPDIFAFTSKNKRLHAMSC